MALGQRDELFALLEEAVAEGIFPGCVALVWRAGAVVYHEAHGRLGIDASVAVRDEPVRRETVFDLSSLTKVLATTSLTAIGVSEGWMHLDDPVPAPWGRRCPGATLAHLLEHSAGYAAWWGLYRGAMLFDAQGVLDRLASLPLDYPVGARSVYSDLGFMVLGAWLERVTGKPLDRLFRDRIVYPLGLEADPLDHVAYRRLSDGSWMPSTLEPWVAPTEVYDLERVGDDVLDYVDLRSARQACAHGEVHDDNAFVMGGVAGHAGLFGTAWGVFEVARAWLEDLIPGLDPVVRRRFWQPSAVAGSVRRLGFDGIEPGGLSSAGERFSPYSVGHLGFTGTSLWIDPRADDPRIVVLLSNRVHPRRTNGKITAFRPRFHDLAMCL